MNKAPLSKIQLFAALLPLVGKIKNFQETGSGSLTATEVSLMQDVYKDVQVFSSGVMAQKIDVSCVSCIREAFHVFSSLYDRLEKDPDVNPEAEKIENEPLSPSLPGSGLEVDDHILTESEKLFSDRRHALEALGVKYDPDTDTFTHPNGSTFNSEPVIADEDFNATLEFMKKDAESLLDTKEGKVEETAPKVGDIVNNGNPNAGEQVNQEPEPDNGNVVLPPPVFAPEKEPVNPEVKGTPLNTPETLSPQQKANATKAKKAAEKEAKAKAEAEKEVSPLKEVTDVPAPEVKENEDGKIEL